MYFPLFYLYYNLNISRLAATLVSQKQVFNPLANTLDLMLIHILDLG